MMLKIVAVILGLGVGAGARGAESADAYFPLKAGTTWKYRVTIKGDGVEAKTAERGGWGRGGGGGVGVGGRGWGGKPVMGAGYTAYGAKEDGVYGVGVVRGGKV